MLLELYTDVELTPDFQQAYYRTISNWSYLSFYLANKDPSPETIGKLIKLEMTGRCRPDILNRLVQRLGSLIRKQLQQELQEELDVRRDTREVRREPPDDQS